MFTDIAPQIDFIDETLDYPLDMYVSKKSKTTLETSLDCLNKILPVLEEIEDFTKDNVHEKLMALVEQLGVKNGFLLFPLRIALSGKQVTPCGGVELCAILGKEESLARIKKAIERLSAQ